MKPRGVTAVLVAVLVQTPAFARAADDQPAAGAAPAAAEPAAAAEPKFSKDQLDQVVAPVALYPDPLLMQVLMASTYPLEVVEADRWRRQQKDVKDDALDEALEQKDWDPSVEGLTHFPDLLKRMSDNLDWTKDLGDAFLDQKDDTLDAIQRMRRAAKEAGTLQTTQQQTVTTEKEKIVIEPADPQTVYVPTYPQNAYGTSYAPPQQYYPPAVYGYTGTQMATASLLSFGLGVGVGALISDGCDWDDGDVHVNNNYYGGGGGGGKNQNVNVNVDKNVDRSRTVEKGDRTWQHNPEHRRNVGYRDQGTQKRYQARTQPATRPDRSARGFDSAGADGRGPGAQPRPATRDQQAAGDRGQQPNRGGGRDAQSAARGGRDSAFGGQGNAGKTREASQRGAKSRGGPSYAGRSPSPQRGGGGGGGRGGGGGKRGGGGGGRRR